MSDQVGRRGLATLIFAPEEHPAICIDIFRGNAESFCEIAEGGLLPAKMPIGLGAQNKAMRGRRRIYPASPVRISQRKVEVLSR